jgi:hypothetical protein
MPGDIRNWPPEFRSLQGEPVMVPGAQNLVVQYNDLDGTPVGNPSQKLGVEVRQRSLAYRDAAKKNAIIFVWEVTNISGGAIEGAYFGFWADADVGYAFDDRSSVVNDMAILWDNDFYEQTFDRVPAIVAFDFLETPSGSNPTPSYCVFTNGSPNADPVGDYAEYMFLSGGVPFEYPYPQDLRMLLSTGPFSLAYGQSVVVAGALVLSDVPPGTQSLATGEDGRPDPNDPILAQLLVTQQTLRQFYNLYLKGMGLPKGAEGGFAAAEQGLPTVFSLGQNYPNPFNPSTTIDYELPTTDHVTLTVYNLLGQAVTVLVDEVQEAGYKSVDFDATSLPSGVYLYRLTAGDCVATKKLVVVK